MHRSSRPEAIDQLRVAVVGAGLMGHSIAGVFASTGAAVAVFDPDRDARDAVQPRVREQLTRLGRNQEAAAAIRLSSDLESAVDAVHLVVEAAPERLELKQQLFRDIGAMSPDGVLATNTSVFRIGDVAKLTPRPSRVLGTHWFNPPHLIPLVEVIQGTNTSAAEVEWVIDMLRQAGKVPVHVRKDVPGFVGNRLQHAMWREAMSLIDSGVCDAETVDLVVRNSFGPRLAAMGPIENADYVGLDLVHAVHEYVFPSLARNSEPARALTEHVQRGELGAKTGSGFFEWGPGQRDESATRLEQHLLRHLREASGVPDA